MYLKTHKEHYYWRKPESTIHNLILGRLWIDHVRCAPTMRGHTVVGAAERAAIVSRCRRCRMTNRFGRARQEGDVVVKNTMTGDEGTIVFQPYERAGDEYHRLVGKVTDASGKALFKLGGAWNEGLKAKRIGAPGSKAFDVWRVRPRGKDSARQFGFTPFAITLNQPLDGPAPTVRADACPSSLPFQWSADANL